MSEMELEPWSLEREFEKDLWVGSNGGTGILPSISEESDGGKGWKDLRV